MFRGTFTALSTPYTEEGELDTDSFRRLIDSQIQGGVSGLVPTGTTGESPTLTHQENIDVVKMTVELADGKIPVIAGTGANSTSEALYMTKEAKEIGASASLQVVPYYNKPSEEGIYGHFMAIADQVDMPIIVYNIPGRTGTNLSTETLMRLAKHPNIVGVKEASGSVVQMMEVLEKRPDDFCVLSGDDNLTLPLIALGGDGVISVASNILPREISDLVTKALSNEFDEAREIHYKVLNFCRTLFLESNPIPIKEALAIIGIFKSATFRLPMCNMSKEGLKVLKEEMKKVSLI